MVSHLAWLLDDYQSFMKGYNCLQTFLSTFLFLVQDQVEKFHILGLKFVLVQLLSYYLETHLTLKLCQPTFQVSNPTII